VKNNVQTIKTIKSEKANSWVNAKDRLPEPDVTVAVLTSTGQTLTAECSHQTTRAEFLDGNWEIVWYLPINAPKKRKTAQPHHARRITHWMAFPESPLQIVETKA
jgi:hypothetical protein